MDPDHAGPLENFGKVSADLYRGAAPSTNGFVTLKRLGIKSIVDLRSGHDDRNVPGFCALGFDYYRLPMHQWDAADDAKMARFLKIVRAARKPVFVHCAAGEDRTGCAVAVYSIVERHESVADAMAERRNFHPNWVWLNVTNYLSALDRQQIDLLRAAAASGTGPRPEPCSRHHATGG